MRCLGWLALLAACAGAQPAPDELLPNGGFEGDYPELAPAWTRNCYGVNEVRFERQTVGAHGGAACQRVVCTAFEGGGVQLHSSGLPVEQGRPYTISAWVRGEFEGPLYVGLRKFGEPYTGYLVRYFRIGPRWRRVVVAGDAAGSDPDCGLFFQFASPGWLELDDASVRPGAWPAETAAVDTPPVKGNRIYNSGFELDAAGWAPLGGALRTAERGAPQGRQYLLAPGGWAETRPFVITPGQIYTLSGWFRRAGGEARLSVELAEFADAAGDAPGRRDVLSGEVAVGPEWRRAVVTGLFEAAFTSGALLRLRCPGGFEADGVQVEEGALTDWAPQQAVEVAADVPAPLRFPSPGGSVTAAVAVASGEPLTDVLPLSWRIVDLWEKPIATGTLRLPTAGKRDARGAIALKLPAVGLYRLELRAGGPQSVPGDVVLGVLPRLPDAPRCANGFYGVHAPPALDPAEPDLAVKVSARAGCTWHRIHDFDCWVQWFEVEPEPGQRILPDAQTDHLRAAGYDLVGTLARTPPWAGKPGGANYGLWTASPPRDIEQFKAYVRDTVRHYKDRIHTWEIWNEPYGSGFFSGTPEEYAEVLTAGSAACREADPSCTVLGLCAFLGLPEWVERVLKVSGTAPFDVFSYHRYIVLRDVQELGGKEPLVYREVETIRELMRRYGGERRVQQSEGGVACPTFHAWLPPDGLPHTPRQAAETLAKAVVEMRAAGVERWYYYYAGSAHGGRGDYYTLGNAPYILLDFDSSPKATLMALAASAQVLRDGVYLGRVRAGALRAWRFRVGRGEVAAVWVEGGGTANARLPRGWSARNLMGAPLPGGSVALSSEPVYLSAAALPEEQLRTIAPTAAARPPAAGS